MAPLDGPSRDRRSRSERLVGRTPRASQPGSPCKNRIKSNPETPIVPKGRAGSVGQWWASCLPGRCGNEGRLGLVRVGAGIRPPSGGARSAGAGPPGGAHGSHWRESGPGLVEEAQLLIRCLHGQPVFSALGDVVHLDDVRAARQCGSSRGRRGAGSTLSTHRL